MMPRIQDSEWQQEQHPLSVQEAIECEGVSCFQQKLTLCGYALDQGCELEVRAFVESWNLS